MTTDILLTRKQLAAELQRSRMYVWAMQRRGFKMPGGRASLGDALEWLAKHELPMRRKQK